MSRQRIPASIRTKLHILPPMSSGDRCHMHMMHTEGEHDAKESAGAKTHKSSATYTSMMCFQWQERVGVEPTSACTRNKWPTPSLASEKGPRVCNPEDHAVRHPALTDEGPRPTCRGLPSLLVLSGHLRTSRTQGLASIPGVLWWEWRVSNPRPTD